MPLLRMVLMLLTLLAYIKIHFGLCLRVSSKMYFYTHISQQLTDALSLKTGLERILHLSFHLPFLSKSGLVLCYSGNMKSKQMGF